MKKSDVTKLIDLYMRISKCHACNLPANCRPQLRPPGPDYKKKGIVFVQINPGYIGVMDKKEVNKTYVSVHNRKIAEQKKMYTKKIMEFQDHLLQSPSIENFNLFVDFFHENRNLWGWPPGKFKKTVEEHGVEFKDIAVINLAQCPVEKNKYGKILKPCFEKWFMERLDCLQPVAIVAQGKAVYNFLNNVDLPQGVKLIEGLHHADRRSNLIKHGVIKSASSKVKRLI